MARRQPEQELFLVFGGEVKDPAGDEFADLDRINTVGIYSSYKRAHEAWQGASQRSVDNAFMRYVIVHLHELLHPKRKPARRKRAKRKAK